MNPPETTGICLDAKVVRVIDGDTVEVETAFRHRLRLEDCWAEETRLGRNTTQADKDRGLEAKAFLEFLLKSCGQNVRVLITGNDGDLSKVTSMSRVVGRMWRVFSGEACDEPGPESKDVSEIMVTSGYATKEKQ